MHESATAGPDRDQPAATVTPRATPATSTQQLLALQRAAGNRAVGRLLSRYEAGEHSQFGTAGRTITINGFSFDARYLVAMGDYYKTSDKLTSAKAGELKELVDLIDRDEQARMGKGAAKVEEKEWTAWSTKWRTGDDVYMELNKANEHHFAPRNKQWWEAAHRKALKEAQASGNGTGVVSDKARLLNGFGLHFLTDAFAGGHLLDKIAIKDAAKTSLKAGSNRDDLALAVARGILSTKRCVDALAGMQIKDGALVGSWGPPTEPRLASLLASVMRFKADDFGSVFARVAHDDLNSAIGRGKGPWVENAAGDRWQLSGDETLAKSPKTLEITRKAVKASEDNLATAATIKDQPAWAILTPNISEAQYQRFLDNVWQYAPKPTTAALPGEGTQTGADQVAEAVSKGSNAADADTVKAIVKLSIDQFDTALTELRANNLIRATPPPETEPLRPRYEKPMP